MLRRQVIDGLKVLRPSGIFGDKKALSLAQIAMPPLRHDPSLPLSYLTNLFLQTFLIFGSYLTLSLLTTRCQVMSNVHRGSLRWTGDQLRLHSCVKDLCRGCRGSSLNLHNLSFQLKTSRLIILPFYNPDRQFSRTDSPLFIGGTVYRSSWLDTMV